MRLPFHLRALARALLLTAPVVALLFLVVGAFLSLPRDGRATAARNGNGGGKLESAATPAPAAAAIVDEIEALYREIKFREAWLPGEELLPEPELAVGEQGRPVPAPPRRVPPPPGPIRRMSVPRLGIDHYVETVAVLGGEMQAPVDGVYAIGWYYDFGTPNQGGNTIFSAHETWNRFQGPFYRLHRAVAGDEVIVEMRDGARLRYVVTSNVRYNVDTIPMAEVIWPSKRGNQEWITLITCGGRIVYDATGYGEYLDRDVIVARRVE